MNNLYDRLLPGRPRCPEYDEILAMRRDGHTYDSIAYLIGISKSTVASACQKAGLTGRGNLIDRAPVLELRAQGLSHSKISQRLGLALGTVKSILRAPVKTIDAPNNEST